MHFRLCNSFELRGPVSPRSKMTTRFEDQPWHQEWHEALDRVIAAQMRRDGAKLARQSGRPPSESTKPRLSSSARWRRKSDRGPHDLYNGQCCRDAAWVGHGQGKLLKGHRRTRSTKAIAKARTTVTAVGKRRHSTGMAHPRAAARSAAQSRDLGQVLLAFSGALKQSCELAPGKLRAVLSRQTLFDQRPHIGERLQRQYIGNGQRPRQGARPVGSRHDRDLTQH